MASPIPAACALGWSVRLDKALRSRNPDKRIQAIEELGSQLEMWNTNSDIPYAAYAMFSLVPCEDKLFLNAIFLRLIDTFRVGNKQTKNRIVTLFLRMRRKARTEAGILSKDKLENYLQLLTIVKQVYDEGDSEDRALALAVFGCWPYLIKDCADVRYILLASLVSSDVTEVRAGLFAAGCLSEVSDHFAFVFLEVLTRAVFPACMSREIKLAGARSFSKLWHSSTVADKAHKAGSKLLKDSDGDDFSAVMLISLTKIVSKWMFLIPYQMDLITSLLNEEVSLRLKMVSLRCYYLILERGACFLFLTSETCDTLFGLLSTVDLRPLHLQALKVLHKILLITVSTVPVEGIIEIFHKLLAVTSNMLKSSIIPVRTLAVSVLVDSCARVLGMRDLIPVEHSGRVAHMTISFILNHILLIMTASLEEIQVTECTTLLDVKSILQFLFNLVWSRPQISCMLLKNIIFFIGEFLRIIDKMTVKEQSSCSNEKMIEFHGSDKALIVSKTLVFVAKIVASCLYTLEESDLETLQLLDDLKYHAERICHSSLFCNYTCLTYILLLHQNSSICMQYEIKNPLVRNSSFSSLDSIFKLDLSALDFVKKNLIQNCYYSAYKAGKSAMCQGAWSTAAFIFENLVTKVQSFPYSTWINFLWHFSTSEKHLQLFLLPDQGESFVREVGDWASAPLNTHCLNCMENLLRAFSTLLATTEILEPSELRHQFTFQRWFLYLRAKFLKIVSEVFTLLSENVFGQDVTWTGEKVDRIILYPCVTQKLPLLIHSSIELSRRMNRLAQQFDLLLTSFMAMDAQSRMTVSALAMSCSFVALTVGFSFLMPNLNDSGSFGVSFHENKQELIHALLVSDLIVRLRPTYNNCRQNLLFLLSNIHKGMHYDFKGLQNKMPFVSLDSIWLNKLCEYPVEELVNMQKELARVQCNEDTISEIIKKSSKLLLNCISNVILIPFRVPKHFFCAGPPASAELFLMNEDGKTVCGTSVPSGEQLSLNLCLQVRNLANPPSSNVYCIICCQAQSLFMIESDYSENQGDETSEAHQIDDMTDLNAKLWKHIVHSADANAPDTSDSSTVNEYTLFQLNERGQGFSTCLLDVSNLPSGSYIIKWHSGFVDNGGAYWSLIPLNSGSLFSIAVPKNKN